MKLLVLFFCIASLAFGDELLRPTTDGDSSSTSYGCTGTHVVSTSFPNARDAAGLSTSSSGSVTGGGCRKFLDGNCVVQGVNNFSARLFGGWPASGNTWSSLTINVNWATTGGSLPQDSACVAYSLNSGSTWTSIACSGAGNLRAQTTSAVSIATGQDLTKLRIGICIEGTGFPNGGTGSGTGDITVWDIWTLGTNNVPPPAPAPSPSARPSDPVIISRRWEELKHFMAVLL